METPRSGHYAAGPWARPARLVRGSSRRITIMRFRPANIRVINRRDRRFDRPPCGMRDRMRDLDQRGDLTGSFHISGLY
jgi:hypothetical protein